MLCVVDVVGEEDPKAVFRFIQQKHKMHPGMGTVQKTRQSKSKAKPRAHKTAIQEQHQTIANTIANTWL